MPTSKTPLGLAQGPRTPDRSGFILNHQEPDSNGPDSHEFGPFLVSATLYGPVLGPRLLHD